MLSGKLERAKTKKEREEENQIAGTRKKGKKKKNAA